MNQKISESYIINFDLSYSDCAILTVGKHVGNKIVIVNEFIGDDAIDIYTRLTNQK